MENVIKINPAYELKVAYFQPNETPRFHLRCSCKRDLLVFLDAPCKCPDCGKVLAVTIHGSQ